MGEMATKWIDTLLKWKESKRNSLSSVHPTPSSPKSGGNHNNPNCYEITSPSGQPIFKVMQKFDQVSTSSESCQSLKKTALKLCIFDMRSGNEILTLTSKPGSDSVIVSSRQKFFQYNGIGKIIRIDHGTAWKGPDYNVRGANGKVAIKVNGNRCFFYKNTMFDICTPDNKECYGKIHKDCEGYDPKDNNNVEAKNPVYRINFPLDLSMVSKALILSTALTMDLDYFECGEKEAKSDFLLFTVGLALVTLIVLLFVIILSVVITSKVSSYINSHYGNHTNDDRGDGHYTASTEFDDVELFVESTTQHIK
ncbi:unnamed protein product [Orchesella dallaii]|uniref:Phospholipid scramblase n=1 Tax=Orchesella dallaii TaxID=48710 RepID=A0ABP1Q5H5_9HEXA